MEMSDCDHCCRFENLRVDPFLCRKHCEIHESYNEMMCLNGFHCQCIDENEDHSCYKMHNLTTIDLITPYHIFLKLNEEKGVTKQSKFQIFGFGKPAVRCQSGLLRFGNVSLCRMIDSVGS